jgi:dATP pyrophosphohydrolase
MRAPLQILVFPYRMGRAGSHEFAVFRRSDDAKIWQGIAGGGEDDETPLQAAIRESNEEAQIPEELDYQQLDSVFTVPVAFVRGFEWGPDVLVIPQHTFGVNIGNHMIVLSEEHTEFVWCGYEEAVEKLTFESNQLALWELNHRLTR